MDPAKPRSEYSPRRVRLWAKRNGIHLSSRGAIPRKVLDVYREVVLGVQADPERDPR